MQVPTALVLLMVPFAGCLVASADSAHEGLADKCEYAITLEYIEGSEMVESNGTVRWLDIEGGFWGIEADDGRRFQPRGDFCKDLQTDGLRVHFMGRTRPDTVSIHQWGTIIDLTLVERA